MVLGLMEKLLPKIHAMQGHWKLVDDLQIHQRKALLPLQRATHLLSPHRRQWQLQPPVLSASPPSPMALQQQSALRLLRALLRLKVAHRLYKTIGGQQWLGQTHLGQQPHFPQFRQLRLSSSLLMLAKGSTSMLTWQMG